MAAKMERRLVALTVEQMAVEMVDKLDARSADMTEGEMVEWTAACWVESKVGLTVEQLGAQMDDKKAA